MPAPPLALPATLAGGARRESLILACPGQSRTRTLSWLLERRERFGAPSTVRNKQHREQKRVVSERGLRRCGAIRPLRSATPQLCPPLAGVWLAPCFPSGRNFWGSFSITPSREPPGLPASRATLFPSIPPTECVVLRSSRLPPPVFEALAKPADLTNSLDPSQGDPAMGIFLLIFLFHQSIHVSA